MKQNIPSISKSSKGRSSTLFWYLLLFLWIFFPGESLARDQVWIGTGFENIYPLAGLHDRFEPIYTNTFSAGWRQDEKSRIMLQYRFMDFSQINREKIAFDSLYISLENYSGGLLYQYEVFKPVTWFTFYIQAGLTLNNWTFKRDAFYTVIQPDSVDIFVPTIVDLEEHKRMDWSWGGKAGFGLEVSPLRWIDIGWHGNVHLIAAELWPMLILDMENVSGLKMFEHQFYLRLSYRW